jgi:hypothetical protein
MNKQDHSESFVIEMYVVLKGVHEIFVGFSIGVNFICGNISRSDPYYNMLFEYCSDNCDPIYNIKAKLKNKL